MAPAIRASANDVAAAIGFSALVGVVQIALLPLLVPGLDMTHYQYGVIAGIAVYATPQVVAASFSVSNLAGETATMVKLTRILFLGPVVLALGILHRRRDPGSGASPAPALWRSFRFVPWFLAGFIALAALRSAGVISDEAGDTMGTASKLLFVVAMVGLGYGVSIGKIWTVGPRLAVTVVAAASFMVMLALLGTSLLDISG